jgi:O-antigen ligase
VTALWRHPPAALLGLAAVAIAAAWPLTAMELSPMLLPVLLVGGAGLAVALARPAMGIALVLVLAPQIDGTIAVAGTSGELSQPLQLLLPALVLCIAFAGLMVRSPRAVAVPTLLSLVPLLFLGLTLASSMQAISPSQSVNSVVILAVALLLFYSTLRIGAGAADRTTIVAGALLGLLLAGVQGVLQRLLGLAGPYGVEVGGSQILRVQGSFDHPNAYSVFLVTLIPLAVAVALTATASPRLRRLAAAAAVFGVIGVVLAYSRGAIIGLVIGSLAWVFLLRPGRVTVLAVVAAVVAIALAPASLKERFDPAAARSDAGLREQLWQAGYDIGSSEPLLGVGPNNFSAAYERLINRRGGATDRPLLDQGHGFVLPSSSHNMYLNTLAEQGILGLLGLALLALATLPVLYSGRRLEDPFARAVCGGLGAGVATWAVRGMFDAGLYGDVILPVAALTAVSVLAVGDRSRAP